MSYRRDLRHLRRARRLAKYQLRQLAAFELTGLTAVTLHAHTRQLMITLVSATGAPFTDAIRETLRERRQALQAEAQQILATWLEDEQLRIPPTPVAGSPLP